ncbi:MAG: TetR/AcrR family transcriptional regulator [Pseudomonadota bacterium]
MPRPAGVRNHDFEEKRTALLETLTEFALTDDLRRPSLRQFAIAAGASEPTLRHYFGDRRGLVIAILEHINLRAQPLWTIVATGASDPEAAVEEYFRVTKAGMEHGGFARAHAFGIIEGLADTEIGDAYLKFVLDPALATVSDKLAATPGGPNERQDGHVAAFMILAPLLVMTLHQELLGGSKESPIDQDGFLDRVKTWMASALMAHKSS